ncbi:MAG: AtpZ/AtpI family protein [Patescibacteria group bacterium]|jgi:F0F1-type ATP synthase assembly protein I
MDNKPQIPWWQPAVTIFAEVTGWIAVPILIALFLGKYLDEKYGTDPWYYLGLTAVAFIISSTGIVIVAGKYIRQIEKENKNKKNESDSKQYHNNTKF